MVSYVHVTPQSAVLEKLIGALQINSSLLMDSPVIITVLKKFRR
jgi:hypothetical protein